MAFCTDCGGSVESNHDYCYSCGSRIEHPEPVMEAVPVVEGETESAKPRPVYMTAFKRIGGVLLMAAITPWLVYSLQKWEGLNLGSIDFLIRMVIGLAIFAWGWELSDVRPLFERHEKWLVDHGWLQSDDVPPSMVCPSCKHRTSADPRGQCFYCRADLPTEALTEADASTEGRTHRPKMQPSSTAYLRECPSCGWKTLNPENSECRSCQADLPTEALVVADLR